MTGIVDMSRFQGTEAALLQRGPVIDDGDREFCEKHGRLVWEKLQRGPVIDDGDRPMVLTEDVFVHHASTGPRHR